MNIIHYRYTSKADAIPSVPLASQRIIFADPPYNQGVKYADDPSHDRLELPAYQNWIETVIFTLSQHLCPGGTLWWLCPPAYVDWVGNLLTKHVGPRLYLIIKTETFSQYQQKTLTQDYRLLYCHQRPGGSMVFNPDDIRVRSKRQELGDKRADPRGRVPGWVWNIRRLQGTSDARVPWHPCQVAPELLARIVLGWSNLDDKVLDGFAGSGNMGEVCRATGREFTGVDGSETYCQKMRERLLGGLCEQGGTGT